MYLYIHIRQFLHNRINPHTRKSLLVGSQQDLSSVEPQAVIPDLASGGTYTIKIQARTTMGDSDYSTPTIASTIMAKTELDQFRSTLNLDTIENNIKSKLYQSTLFKLQTTSNNDYVILKTGNKLIYTFADIGAVVSTHTAEMSSHADLINRTKNDLSSEITGRRNSMNQIKTELSSKISSQNDSMNQIKTELSSKISSQRNSMYQIKNDLNNAINNVTLDLAAHKETAVTVM